MNKSKQRILSLLMTFSVFILMGSMVYAESYSSTLSVTTYHMGNGRTYSGTTMHISCSDTYLQTNEPNHESDMLWIELEKNDFLWIIYHEVGSDDATTIYKPGAYTHVSGSWTMDGNGSYRFCFTKRDTQYGSSESIKSNNVNMWSN